MGDGAPPADLPGAAEVKPAFTAGGATPAPFRSATAQPGRGSRLGSLAPEAAAGRLSGLRVGGLGAGADAARAAFYNILD